MAAFHVVAVLEFPANPEWTNSHPQHSTVTVAHPGRVRQDFQRFPRRCEPLERAALCVPAKDFLSGGVNCELAEGMVRDSLNSLVRADIDLARSVLQRDDQVDRLRDQLFRELLTYMMENSAVVFAAFELILVAKNLERIGDHATNIAEDVIYFVAGRDVRHPALDRR